MSSFEPAYIRTFEQGLLKEKTAKAWSLLKSCILCPRKCGVDRLSGETGTCKTAKLAWVSSYNPHFGEEEPLVGTHGSGTIFFTHCNLLCIFCQNFDISHQGNGRQISDDELAGIMLVLQNQGCHNINFVTPSHVVPQILSAVEVAVPRGLSIPLVFNTGGYDRITTLKLMDGVIDIYMPDFKFWDSHVAEITCQAGDYPEVAKKALIEMHRQRISPDSYVNVMSQYRPCGRAVEVKGLNSQLPPKEYHMAVKAAKQEGITRLDQPRRMFWFR